MFIPPKNINAQFGKKAESGGPVRLKSSHLLFQPGNGGAGFW